VKSCVGEESERAKGGERESERWSMQWAEGGREGGGRMGGKDKGEWKGEGERRRGREGWRRAVGLREIKRDRCERNIEREIEIDR
jgi:hypothetical protein